MVKAHSPINWENEPSTKTPINKANLNKMDSTIGILDDRIITLDVEKLDKTTANNMVKSISFDESTGIFTITLLSGSTTTIDTKLEKIAINFGYNSETQKITLELIDGTTQEIDLSSLITHYEFVDSDTIGWEVTTDGKVKAKILNGSITEDMLQPNYLAEIKVETEKSAQSATNAKASEIAAAESADKAEQAFNSIGFTPVQQGGGANQGTNKIYIGWDGSELRAQVDWIDFGGLAFRSDLTWKVLGNVAYQAFQTLPDYWQELNVCACCNGYIFKIPICRAEISATHKYLTGAYFGDNNSYGLHLEVNSEHIRLVNVVYNNVQMTDSYLYVLYR